MRKMWSLLIHSGKKRLQDCTSLFKWKLDVCFQSMLKLTISPLFIFQVFLCCLGHSDCSGYAQWIGSSASHPIHDGPSGRGHPSWQCQPPTHTFSRTPTATAVDPPWVLHGPPQPTVISPASFLWVIRLRVLLRDDHHVRQRGGGF